MFLKSRNMPEKRLHSSSEDEARSVKKVRTMLSLQEVEFQFWEKFTYVEDDFAGKWLAVISSKLSAIFSCHFRKSRREFFSFT